MTSIALQILEGHQRGRTYSDLPTPITIGREEDNAIRLNDERASRFHAKIQTDDGRVILTDLDSTNGTRVNGHLVQMRVLQSGDQILIGRSLIAFWPSGEVPATGDPAASRSESADSSADSSGDSFDSGFGDAGDAGDAGNLATSSDFDQLPVDAPSPQRRTADGTIYKGGTVDGSSELFPDGPPPLPTGLTPAQRAELSDLLSYAQQGLVAVAVTSYSGDGDGPDGEHMVVPSAAWRHFMAVQKSLAEYLAQASSPEG